MSHWNKDDCPRDLDHPTDQDSDDCPAHPIDAESGEPVYADGQFVFTGLAEAGDERAKRIRYPDGRVVEIPEGGF